MNLSQVEQGVLLLSARQAIQGLFDPVIKPQIDYRSFPRLKQQLGAFVTLTKNDELRGCIGYIYTEMTLFETVCEAARLAATHDYRFPPLLESEINQIIIEISVLSSPVPIKNYNEIQVGVHGLILNDPHGSGVLLPQVAVENNFDVYNFLSALCQKAGLNPYEWKERQLDIQVFTAEVFSEIRHRNLSGEHN